MKRIIKFWPLLLVLVVAAGAYWYYQTQMVPASASSTSGSFSQIVPVRQGALNSTVSVVGELDAVQSEALAFGKMSGSAKLTKLNVAAGNTVKQGDVLASIDP